MEVIIVVGGVDGDVRLRLILVAARFFAFWSSWIVSTSPQISSLSVSQSAGGGGGVCLGAGQLVRPASSTAAAACKQAGGVYWHSAVSSRPDSATDSSSASHNLLVQQYLTQSYYQITFEPCIKDHKQARNI